MIGRAVGNYRVEKVLGAGGMGEVYLVRHQRLPNTVAALKVMRGGAASAPEVTQRFVQEALVAAAIGGHRVARPLDVGRFEDGAPYILMEYVEGRTLALRLATEGPLPVVTLLAIAYRIADTMALAHARGIVHRDLKPSNIMLAGPAESQVKLLDFGVARAVGDLKVAVTRETQIIGSPGYLSPEAASGLPVDGKTDVFSLGVLIFKMATDQLPFSATLDREALSRLLTEQAPTLSSQRPGAIPSELDDLVAQSFAKEPAQRPTMEEVRDRLRGLLKAEAPCEPLSAVTPTPTPTSREADPLGSTVTHIGAESDLIRMRERVEKFAASRLQAAPSRRRIWFGFVAALLLMSVVGVIVQLTRTSAEGPSRATTQRAARQRQITFKGNVVDAALSPDGRKLTYASGSAVAVLDLVTHKEETVVQAGNGKFARLPSRHFLRWSPDSSEIWFYGPSSGEPYYSVVSREVTAVPTLNQLEVRPHSNEVAEYSMPWKYIRVTNRETGSSRRIEIRGPLTWLTGVRWSPKGDRILFQSAHAGKYRISTILPDGSGESTVVEDDTDIVAAEWVRQGTGILYLRGLPTQRDLVYVPVKDSIDHGSSEPVVVLAGLPAEFFSISADDSRLTYLRTTGHSDLWSARLTHQPLSVTGLERLTTDTAKKATPRLSPDGKTCAFSSDDGAASNIFVVSLADGWRRQLTHAESHSDNPAWSPDGRAIAYSLTRPGAAEIWRVDVETGVSDRLAVNDRSHDSPALAWAPGAALVYTPIGNNRFTLYDATTGSGKAIGDEKLGWMFWPRYSPDGRQIALTWNRRDRGQKVWTYSLIAGDWNAVNGESAEVIGWSDDGRYMYLLRDDAESELLQVDLSRHVETRLKLPFAAREGTECDLGRGSRLICAVPTDEADVWTVDDFARLLPTGL